MFARGIETRFDPTLARKGFITRGANTSLGGCTAFTDDDFAEYRYARAWTAWKQRMWKDGRKMLTQTQDGRSRGFCGIEIDIAGMAAHVTTLHMNETADVLVWTASHPHGFMALSASQLDERKV